MRARLFSFCLIIVLSPATRGEDIPTGKFVGTFSNGVSVEFVGIGFHPSAGKKWWQPDGSPLAERPYARINAHVNPSPGGMAREACWRWHGIGDADVQTNWNIEPSYESGADVAGNKTGTPEQALEKCAVTFAKTIKTCTLRFTITTPASDWTTAIETQAGHSSSTGGFDPELGGIGAAFLPQHGDGPDTIVAVSYKIPEREVRLAAIDKNGVLHIAETGSGAGLSDFRMTEFRFRNVVTDDLKSWQLQTRSRKEEAIEFHNVSLEPGQETKVQVVNVQKAPPIAITGQLQLTPTAPQPMPTPQTLSFVPAQSDASTQIKRRQELLKDLAEKHSYKLAQDELLKYLSDAQNEERSEMYRSMMGATSLAGWMSQTDQKEETFETFMLLFQADEAGLPQLASAHNGVTTLAEVLEHVLHLKQHQFECPSGLLMTYMPGDWVLSWDPRQDHELSDAELAAFEKILNKDLDLGVRCEWKTVERPALVVSGRYKAEPKVKESMSEEVAERADGMFEFPARRSNISASVGTYQKFLQAIGEVLMLPVFDESKVRPTKESLFWRYTEDRPVNDNERLQPDVEDAVLKSLSEQLGYELRVEPREVRLLSIQPAE